MHRLAVIFLLLLFSAQSLAVAGGHDCGEMHGMGNPAGGADMAMDMHHDMPCCEDDASEAAADAWQCQLSCEAGACAAPLALVSSDHPLDFSPDRPPARTECVDRPLTPSASLFRPPIAG
ncbi:MULTISPECIES: hypothetical protein [Microbulbifer]|uniref:hypothetical protein n=1 Tax=Microbulbifer TaxID=48073 RepID=UPI001E5DB778|nr:MULTISPECIES: hypothetical protein [Microbulbifer]UHQ53947.1 hypothetical protein LVE68_10520 [Microbulbifer sp. YPW16]